VAVLTVIEICPLAAIRNCPLAATSVAECDCRGAAARQEPSIGVVRSF
jgi:hypothetical protein